MFNLDMQHACFIIPYKLNKHEINFWKQIWRVERAIFLWSARTALCLATPLVADKKSHGRSDT